MTAQEPVVRRVSPEISASYQKTSTTICADPERNTAAFVFNDIEQGVNGHTGMIALVCTPKVFRGDDRPVRIYFKPEDVSSMQATIQGDRSPIAGVAGSAISFQTRSNICEHQIYVPHEAKKKIVSFDARMQPRPSVGQIRREARMRGHRHCVPTNT